jgi:hypothetical protein
LFWIPIPLILWQRRLEEAATVDNFEIVTPIKGPDKVICIDFDGTIVDHQFPRIGEPVPGAFEYMKKFQELGAKLILWTMRNDDPDLHTLGSVLTQAVEYCRDRGIEFWGVNINPNQHTWSRSHKAYAQLYIDDAALGCPLTVAKEMSRPYVDWSIAGPMVASWIKNGIVEEIISRNTEKEEKEETQS